MATNAAPDARADAPPPAQRAGAPGWRDPRLWVGVLVVAVSVVLGARLLASADETVEVWSVRTDLGPGDEVGAADLAPARVRFADSEDLARYVGVDDEIAGGATLTRGLGAGELLPRAALGDASEAGTVQISVAVDDVRVPSSVGPGSVVDVYLLGGGTATDRRRDELVLDDVTVLAADVEQGFGSTGRRKLELAVRSQDVPAFFSLVRGDTEAVLSIARQP